MRRAITLSLAALSILYSAQPVSAAVADICPDARDKLKSDAENQVTALVRSFDEGWKGNVRSADKKAIEGMIKDFSTSLERGDAERIWNELVPKNSRGALAVAMGYSNDDREFSLQTYRTLKSFPMGRRVFVGAFRDALAGRSGRLSVDRIDINSDKGKAVALVKYKNGRRLPVMLVKSGRSWRIDLATMMSVGKPSLVASVRSAAGKLVDGDDIEIADGLLRDAVGLEGAFKRVEESPLKGFLKQEIREEFHLQFKEFDALRGILQSISPQT